MNRDRVLTIALVSVALSMGCFLFLLTSMAGPEESMLHNLEQQLKADSGATIVGMQANALMERRFTEQRVATFTGIALVFVWLPTFVFLFLTSSRQDVTAETSLEQPGER